MKNKTYYCGLLILSILLSCSKIDKKVNQQLIAINPISYTDVTYCSKKDTVLVSTYSGRISKRIKGHSREELVIKLRDEIYSIQYLKKQNMIIASTLNSGILFIDISTGKIKKELKIEKNAWINSIFLSYDETYLIGFDVKGNNHIWNLSKGYEKLKLTKELSNSYIRFADKSGFLYFQTQDKYIKWDPIVKKIENEFKISGRLVDVNENGDLLSLNFNEFEAFSSKADSVLFKKKHPYYIYKLQNGDTVHDPYQLKLTDARFGMEKIYTSGLDQSIRVWSKINGKLLDEWYEHNATISALDITQEQMVSVDLKGGIKFWNLKN